MLNYSFCILLAVILLSSHLSSEIIKKLFSVSKNTIKKGKQFLLLNVQLIT